MSRLCRGKSLKPYLTPDGAKIFGGRRGPGGDDDRHAMTGWRPALESDSLLAKLGRLRECACHART